MSNYSQHHLLATGKYPETILAEFLNIIGQVEEKVECTRQILVENKHFDAIEAFKRLDYNRNGKVTPQCLSLFLEENHIYLQAESINLLFEELDRDGDGVLDWDEFIKTIISRECNFYESGNGNHSQHQVGRLHPDLEFSMSRIFEEELAGLIKMEKFKLQLSIHPDLGTVRSFRLLDPTDRGFFDLRDIKEFITEHFDVITFQRAERILRRLDLDCDGKVIYQEWNQTTKPRSLNDNLIGEIDSNEEWLKEQELRLKIEKIVSPEKFLKEKYDSDSIHKSKVNITPSKQYIRTPIDNQVSAQEKDSYYNSIPIKTSNFTATMGDSVKITQN